MLTGNKNMYKYEVRVVGGTAVYIGTSVNPATPDNQTIRFNLYM